MQDVRPLGQKRHRDKSSRFWRAFVHSRVVQKTFVLIMKLFFGLRADHPERWRTLKPSIYVCNHGSHYDLFLGLAAFYENVGNLPVPVVWKGTLDMPVLSSLLRAMPAVAVDHADNATTSRASSLREMIRHLRDGRSLLIACEGRRHNQLGDFEAGAAWVSLQTGAPVVPASLCGVQGLYDEVARPKRFWGRVNLFVHPPLLPTTFEKDGGTRDEIVARFTLAIREQIASQIDYPDRRTAAIVSAGDPLSSSRA